MEKYIRVEWPESQEWIFGEFEDDVELGNEEGVVFVPEELYNQVNDGESNLDCNGNKIEIGSKVHWNDEAGVDDDDEEIEFTVVEKRGDGYFNLGFDANDTTAERWAFRTEIEVIE